MGDVSYRDGLSHGITIGLLLAVVIMVSVTVLVNWQY